MPDPEFDPLPPPPPEIAKDATDLKALRTAVADAASISGTLWLSYLFTLFYLALAAASVTHEDLFFERGVKLPFLNIDLPLKAFFALGPAIFIIVHAYVLLHFDLLAGKTAAFDRELRAQIADDTTRTELRRQLPSNIFIQFLAGPQDVRGSITGVLFRVIAWISLAVGPILLLLIFLLQFLPHHHEVITWWQRAVVLLDLALVVCLWPGIVSATQDRESLSRSFKTRFAGPHTVPVVLILLTATFPGDVIHSPLLRVINVAHIPFIPPFLASEFGVAFKHEGWGSLHEFLIDGKVDQVARRPTSPFANVLVLPGLQAVDPAKFDTEVKIEAARETISLRGRRLEGAVLIDAVLRKADLIGVRLQGANLAGADLRAVRLTCGDRGRRNVAEQMFNTARPEECAQLQGASLDGAQLQGASLDGAHLQGASFIGAQLQGASLDRAKLQGTRLLRAQLQGARLDDAQLQGAWLSQAGFQGASLDGAQLQGAELGDTQLQGASLDGTQLQGVLLDGAQFQGASLNACIWPAGRRGIDASSGKVVRSQGFARTGNRAGDRSIPQACEWSPDRLRRLVGELTSDLPPGNSRDGALQRVQATLNPEKPLSNAAAVWTKWQDFVDKLPNENDQMRARQQAWQQAGCARDRAPYVIRGLVRQIRVDPEIPPWQRVLAATFLDEQTCPAAAYLAAADRANLIAIRGAPLPSGGPPNQPR